MGIAEFTTPGQHTFPLIPGVSTYNFVVIGAAGGSTGLATSGGNGAVVTTTYTNVSNNLTINIGGGGGYSIYGGGGGGLTQVFSSEVNITAGGGGGGSFNINEASTGCSGGSGGGEGGVGGEGGAGAGVSGYTAATGGNVTAPGSGGAGNNFSPQTGGSGGSGGAGNGKSGGGGSSSNNSNGNPGAAGSVGGGGGNINTGDGGGGGGGSQLNGSTGAGGTAGTNPFNGGSNGGGGSYGGGGGGGGYGGGGGGVYGGGAGGSTVLLGGLNITYAPAPYETLTYGTAPNVSGDGSGGYVRIFWTDPTPTPMPIPTPTPAPPISNICFPAGTPIKTDQGIVAIDEIDTSYHTINHKRILDITQTTSLDRYLVKFQKDCLGPNWPSADTLMTKEHKVMYTDKLVPAYKFLNISSQVKRVKYNGEIVYNVLMENYGVMSVNNLICETLHPDNLIAKIYKNRFTDEYNDKVIYIMNDSIERRKYYEYKTIVNRIHTTTF